MKLSTLVRFICPTRIVVLFAVFFVSLGVIFPLQLNAFPHTGNPNRTRITAATSAIQWGEMTLRILKSTQGGSPTYNSRCLGYLGVAMYESVVASSSNKKSLAGQLNELTLLPKIDTKQNYNWVIVLNAGQATLLKELYEHTNQANKNSIDSLENVILTNELKKTKKEIANRSIALGKEIAAAIYEWSKTDGGHRAYTYNFDSTYRLPEGNGFWKAPTRGQAPVPLPLHPYWGKNRTFAPNNLTLPIPAMEVTFDYKVGTPYYQEMTAVYSKNTQLTKEEKEIANWWSDDPSQTFSPPGHSYHLATVAIQITNANLVQAAETYARVGMAVADAFINCWKCKYHYHAERPANFIYYNVTTLWDLYWPEPPFPAFYSGHAAQGAAMATVLEEIYGRNFSFTDDSHVGRPNDPLRLTAYPARNFRSFWAAAEESAMSRFYGGIHTKQDNEVGLVEGKKIGTNINQLSWTQ